ncbi:MAG: IMP dehydrogenase, partial [Candidatus Woesearchaeota archaeon]|nr:IMP dehydrogenase [Candidatus Woesearchaeota archaeon]
MAKQISEPISFNGMKREYVRLGPSPSLTKLIRKCERDMLAITYDDITLRTRHSEVGPAEADLSSFFSTNVPLITPQVSAAMSDVTEKDMAIAMANNGGLGIIHNHLSPKEQADQVSAVKHFLNALIDKPIYFNNRQTIGDILEKCARKRWKFRDFPIVNDRDQLIGFIYDRTLKAYTKRPNMRIEDVMCKVSEGRVKTATPGTTLKRAYELMINLNEAVLPLVNKKGELVGMYSMADINRILFENKDNSIKPNVDIYGRLFVGASVGVLVSEGTEERIELLVKAGVDVIEVKQANVNTKIGLDTIRYIKKHFDVDVAAGNIDNPEGVKPLLRAGADAIGIGVGPGSICKTRKVAGS